jgi:hypothetical protein
MKQRNKIKRRRGWTKKEISLVGKITDAEIARRTGRAKFSVKSFRRKLGIPSVNPVPPTKAWTPKDDALMMRLSDKEVARRTGRTLSAVQYRRYLHERLDLTGGKVRVRGRK